MYLCGTWKQQWAIWVDSWVSFCCNVLCCLFGYLPGTLILSHMKCWLPSYRKVQETSNASIYSVLQRISDSSSNSSDTWFLWPFSYLQWIHSSSGTLCTVSLRVSLGLYEMLCGVQELLLFQAWQGTMTLLQRVLATEQWRVSCWGGLGTLRYVWDLSSWTNFFVTIFIFEELIELLTFLLQ